MEKYKTYEEDGEDILEITTEIKEEISKTDLLNQKAEIEKRLAEFE